MKKCSAKIAVIGATGNVGRAMLSILEERGFPIQNITALASARSVGKKISYGEQGVLDVKNLDSFDFSNTHIALSSPGSKVSAIYTPIAAEAGCIVIDNTSHFRMEPDVPLLIPEVNPHALKDHHKRNIIANPNCAMIQLAVALKPLHDLFRIKRVVVSTYQSVSGAGKKAMDELFNSTRSVLIGETPDMHIFHKPIAFNLIPHIDVMSETGETLEEIKVQREFKKVFETDIPITATCVRAPIFIGHSMSVNVEFYEKISLSKARTALKHAEGVQFFQDFENYITPVEAAGEDNVFVSRLRLDPSCEEHGLNLWVVSDNLRKGAALNAVQIAELLLKKKMG